MAAKIIPHNENATDLHGRILRIIEQMDGEADKVFSVAAGGWAMAGEENANERNLFSVIEDLASDRTMANILREAVGELAAMAGAQVKPA